MRDARREALARKLVTQTAIWLLITGVLLFGAAGTLRWAEAWLYLGLLLAGAILSGGRLMRDNPAILEERMRSPLQAQQKRWDKPLLIAIFSLSIILLMVAGLDRRFSFSSMPRALEVAGAAAVVLATYVFHIVMRENAFASTVVKIDTGRGHRVIETGPYAWIRHPMYAGATLYFFGAALMLGSWLAVFVSVLLFATIAVRAIWEEQALASELPGYSAYAERVRYRLLPGIW